MILVSITVAYVIIVTLNPQFVHFFTPYIIRLALYSISSLNHIIYVDYSQLDKLLNLKTILELPKLSEIVKLGGKILKNFENIVM